VNAPEAVLRPTWMMGVEEVMLYALFRKAQRKKKRR
jgi:hypothetical protein